MNGNGSPNFSQAISVVNAQPTNQFVGVPYDGNGNVTAYGAPPAATLTYDVANRLTTVNSTNAYAYDPANQRVYFRNSAGAETLYIYGPGGKIATYTIAGTTGSQVNFTFQSRNVYLGGRLISAEGNAVSVDGLGSMRWSSASGNHTYYPYGFDYNTASANDTEKYATYTRDSVTGLDYAVNRYYASNWGRFVTPDPYGGSANLWNPQSWNRYMYTLGDPINRNDRWGYCSDDGSGDDNSGDDSGGDNSQDPNGGTNGNSGSAEDGSSGAGSGDGEASGDTGGGDSGFILPGGGGGDDKANAARQPGRLKIRGAADCPPATPPQQPPTSCPAGQTLVNGVCDVPLSPTGQQVANQVSQNLSNSSICSVLTGGASWGLMGAGGYSKLGGAFNFSGPVVGIGWAAFGEGVVIKLGCAIATGQP